ncbi:D-alanyl-D-alanine carboxypeptidase family protein [Lederbergia wuyishanensis]|uniref:D-alanyl-D-alanine carboxypeptidase (Penicillin-binding protein 5/6) n=1 Tax=Lederbergia wuyishanensis TaxID=1347903 RepID=A0ABU0D6G5_9BACI|nr:D-alanyl-D-alanine carboxypeptidase family protein [Lederbergia wuyishanensis]MCJ8008595.1 D-alanyl-D-alanine carboxypeptidase [Lederbergia wuyishanensis]MDQ0343989.1 D-alanyl-D-alanine carboxypeptidase (penicillin-binding protein 5/6) [Lederbergia wuyishanensis]
MKLSKKVIIPILLLFIIGIAFFIKSTNETNKPLTVSFLPLQQHEIEPKVFTIKVIHKLKDININAKSAILIDARDGNILYEKNSDEPFPTASMSKMMTEFLVLEAIKEGKLEWDQSITVSDYAYTISNTPGFASVYLKKDQLYTIRDLFYAMAIHSANGATIALAETVSGSEKNFVVKMNEKAKELGLNNSMFVNSTGLNNNDLGEYRSTGGLNDANEMSARDLTILTKGLITQFPEILEISSTSNFTFGGQTYINTNWMLAGNNEHVSFEGVDGLKTGFTDEAGYCFTGTVEKDDIRLISVIMGTGTSLERFVETKKLYEVSFAQVEN